MPYRLEFVLPNGTVAISDVPDGYLVLDETSSWVSPQTAKFISISKVPIEFAFTTFLSDALLLETSNYWVCRVLSRATVPTVTTVYPGFVELIDDSDGCLCMLPTCLGPRISRVPVYVEEE